MKNSLLSFFAVLIILLFTGCPEPDPPTPTLIPTPQPTPNPHCSIIVTFTDPNLETLIREVIGKQSGDIYLCEVKIIRYLYRHAQYMASLLGQTGRQDPAKAF
jgi:hypothetical protein